MKSNSIDTRANELHQEARELGQKGKFDEAILKLQEAILLQPDWAYPNYDLAYTYLLIGDFDKALLFYKKTDAMEPKGFFTAKIAVYSLEGENTGKFPKSLYLYYLQIEWTDDLAKKWEIVTGILQNVPDFAPAWKDFALLLDNKTEKLKAIEQGLSKEPDAETKGILLLNKVALLRNDGKIIEAKEVISSLIFSDDTTTSNLVLAQF